MRVKVEHQAISSEHNTIAEGAVGFTTLDFEFSHDWDRFIKFAQFTQKGRTHNVMLVDNTCHIPSEIRSGMVHVNVAGITPDSHDRACTAYLALNIQKNGMPFNPRTQIPPGHLPPPPPPELPFPWHGNGPGGPELPDGGSLYTELTRTIQEAIRGGNGLVIDPELQKPNQAADAKAAGDRIRALEEACGKDRQEQQDAVSSIRAWDRDQEKRIVDLEEALKGTGEQVERGLETLEETRSQLSGLLSAPQAILGAQEQLKALEEGAEAASMERDTLRADLGTVREDTEALRGRVDTLEAKGAETEDAVRRQGASLENIEGTVRELSGTVEGLGDGRETLLRRMEAAEKGVRDMHQEMIHVQDDVTAAEKTVAAFGKSLEAVKNLAEDAMGETGQTSDQLRDTRRIVLEIRDHTLGEMQGTEEDLLRRMEAAVRRIKGAEDRLQEAEGFREEAGRQLSDLSTAMVSTTVQVQGLEQRLRQAEQGGGKGCEGCGPGAGMISELAALKAELFAEIQALKARLSDNEQVDAGQAEGIRASGDLARAAEEQLKETADKLKAAEELISRMETRIQALQDAAEAAEGDRYVPVSWGEEDAGKIMVLDASGTVCAMDRRLQSQLQPDFQERDPTKASYIRRNPFRMEGPFPACDALVLVSPSGRSYVLGVNNAGSLEVYRADDMP